MWVVCRGSPKLYHHYHCIVPYICTFVLIVWGENVISRRFSEAVQFAACTVQIYVAITENPWHNILKTWRPESIYLLALTKRISISRIPKAFQVEIASHLIDQHWLDFTQWPVGSSRFGSIYAHQRMSNRLWHLRFGIWFWLKSGVITPWNNSENFGIPAR